MHRVDDVVSHLRSDNGTYIRDAKETELHHAWRTTGNEELCQIKDPCFFSRLYQDRVCTSVQDPAIVRLWVAKLTTVTNYEKMYPRQNKYSMFLCTYDGFIQLIPAGVVVSEPMSSPFSTGGVGGPGHHDASFTCHIQEGAAQGRGIYLKHGLNTKTKSNK